jgi:hypothetical protein
MVPIEEIMDMVYKTKRSGHLDTMEKYYMCCEISRDTQIKRLFDVLVHHETQQMA